MVTMTSDKLQAERLYTLLSAMAKALEQLYDCLRSQQKALITWNYEAFVSSTREQNSLARENLRREQIRLALVQQFPKGENGRNLSLRELGALLGEPWQRRFEELASRIRTASGKVSDLKAQNEMLIGKARSLVDGQLKLLLEFARINRNLYEENGKKSKKANLHKVLDQKV
ncbi:MAG: hypothetical protein A3F83_06260 [Candidatus Glassbacteria bacterium RIFCSPLOWO2_12_FULL_58_11]|uniref:Flagellar biosynthesis protein FlgN n=1 Tax=Candidatus Glassbacteria bacterium RIFCSPLOWO2_12_FULL_58_11 TaxID=1817867 RepID=A0A1F5Z378_9BACT|nr:MAG: hypothetical protein A3F83_06260 [Candidatus Glassbacteria bacterium RIFCSPLOWO2_12_FULL_58_11]